MSDPENAVVVFNVADFEASDTAWLDVQTKKEDGPLLFAGKPVRIELYGPGSRENMGAQHKQEVANNLKMYAAIRGKATKETLDGKIQQTTEKLVACTRTIENFPITSAELYSNPKLGYIADQVAKFTGDWANF